MMLEKAKQIDVLNLASFLWRMVGYLSIIVAGTIVAFFDSPSPNGRANDLFLYSVISFPIVCYVVSFGIRFLKNKSQKVAFYITLLPVIPLILIYLGFNWMNQARQQETAVNSEVCEFDGADGLPTSLCQRADKIDNFDELGYLQATTSSSLEAHNWQFPAQHGNQITIRMSTWGRGCPAIRMRILDSQGVVLENFDHPAPLICTDNAPTISMHLFDPPIVGTYTLRVDTPKTPGPYWFQIIEVKKEP
jgi:hypothetical protein